MKKIDAGQLIGVIANVGVILGVAFLVLELRQTNAIARVDSYQQSMSEIAEWRTAILTDAELMRVFELYVSEAGRSDLDESGRLKLTMLMSNLFGAHENAYFAYRYGILSDSEWERFERAACGHFRRIERTGIIDMTIVTQEYLTHLQAAC
jgi:hypothetical protein